MTLKKEQEYRADLKSSTAFFLPESFRTLNPWVSEEASKASGFILQQCDIIWMLY